MTPRAYVSGPSDGWWLVLFDGCVVDRRRSLPEAADRVRGLIGGGPVYRFVEGAWAPADTSPGEGGPRG